MFLFFESASFTLANFNTQTPTTNFRSQQSRLGISKLQKALQGYYKQGLAATTHKINSAGINHYLSFCNSAKLTPLPTSKKTLLLFVTHLRQLKLSHMSIKMYLSAIRSWHISSGYFKSFENQLSPKLEQVLKGIKFSQAKSNPLHSRLQITISIMLK